MEDFVPFLLAKKLKEKGFSLPKSNVVGKFDSDGVFHSQLYINFTETMDSEEITAPTISQVLKWLREEKRIFIDIRTSIDLNGKEHFSYYIIHNKVSIREGYTDFDWKFEQAALAGIEYVIDILI